MESGVKPTFVHSVLVKINNQSVPDTDEFGPEFDMDIEFCQETVNRESPHSYLDMFACEYDNVRFSTIDHWLDDLSKVKSGFYELRYNFTLEEESCETPHIKYAVFEDFELVPSFKARIGYYKLKLRSFYDEIVHFIEAV